MRRFSTVIASIVVIGLTLLTVDQVVRADFVNAYNETFDTGAGIWTGGDFTWNGGAGNPAGEMTVLHQHADPQSGVFQNHVSVPDVTQIAVSGTDLEISFDWYMGGAWTVYSGLQFYVGFTDNTTQWENLAAPSINGVWTTGTFATSFTKQMSYVQFTQVVASVYNNPSAGAGYFVDGLPLAFDNIRVAYAPVPEPGTLMLLATGILGLLAYAWRKRR